MIRIRRSAERGSTDRGFTQSKHTFSFGDYFDPEQMGFRDLRVVNEDRAQAGRGFAVHGHRDMEILTWVVEGAVAQRDTAGNDALLWAGDAQVMRAGAGLQHSEMNPSNDESNLVVQFWIRVRERGGKPSVAQKRFDAAGRRGTWQLVAAPDAGDGALKTGEPYKAWAVDLGENERVEYTIAADRHAWLQVLSGGGEVNGRLVRAGDGVAFSDEPTLTIRSDGESQFVLLDLA